MPRLLVEARAKAIDWEMGQYVPGTWVSTFIFWLQTGKHLVISMPLATGGTRETSLPLSGARNALENVAEPFTKDYERRMRAVDARNATQNRISQAQEAAEARCGAKANDKQSPCAAKLRECILAHPADVLPPEEVEAFIACLGAVNP